MAKLFGINGLLSGKLGNTVFAVTNGIQVARQYNPIVANPKSLLQQQQRAKGNLAGRVSSFTPRTAIVGLGRSNRERRAEFLRQLLKAANVSLIGEAYVAKVADDDVIFSKGSVPLSVVSPSFSATGYSVNVQLYGASTSAMSAEEYAAAQTRLVAMVYDGTSAELVDVVTKIANKPAQGDSAATTLLINHVGGFTCIIYAIPMSTADGSSISISTSIATLSDDDIAASLSANRNAVVFNYGKSMVLGQSVYAPA